MMDTTMDIHQTVNEIVQEDMRRSGFLQELGFDTCCGGQKTLAESCGELCLDPDEILKQLISFDAGESHEADDSPRGEKDWSKVTLTELIDHIESTHHVYLKSALPKVSALISKVREAHEARHPELKELATVFQALKADLEPHMMKEEQILFPAARKLDAGDAGFHCGTLQGPIRVMLMDHQQADGLLGKLPRMTNDFTPPADGCGTYSEMLDELKKLREDVALHIQKENEILFPMILKEEQDAMP